MAAAEGREPRIVDIRWDFPITSTPFVEDFKEIALELREGSTSNPSPSLKSYPEIVIIGKGITFDTGGLNIKGGGGMRNMKKVSIRVKAIVKSTLLPSKCALKPWTVILTYNPAVTLIKTLPAM